jgi:hypothetical protein
MGDGPRIRVDPGALVVGWGGGQESDSTASAYPRQYSQVT